MSNWWDLDFSVAGSETRIDELKEVLAELKFEDGSPLFHRTTTLHGTGSFVVIDASRDYQGIEAVSALAERFPDLSFHGSAWCASGQNRYWVYNSCNGKTTVKEFMMNDFYERLSPRPSDREPSNCKPTIISKFGKKS